MLKKVFFGCCLFTFSCSGESEPEAPQNLIGTEKMIGLVVDLQVLESHFQRTFNRPDLYKESLDSSSALIFEKYDVTKSQFDSSYSYYASSAAAIYVIYEAALDSLNFSVMDRD